MGLFDKGGSSGSSTTQVKLPNYVNDAGKKAVNLATGISQQPYVQYGQPRVAGMSGNERYAYNEAPGELNRYGGAFGQASQYAQQGAAPNNEMWLQNSAAYMNPFMQQAVQPAIREIGNQAEQTRLQNNMQSAQRGAFGGSRTALLESENERNKLQQQGDLMYRGLADAYGQGMQGFALDTDIRNQNRDYALRGADAMSMMPGREAAIRDSAYQRMLQTGGLDRSIQQAGLDTAYGDFLRQQDWPMRGLEAMNSTLHGLPSNQTTKASGQDPNLLTQLAGTGLALFGGGQNSLWNTFFS
jgi:hypothetical protein